MTAVRQATRGFFGKRGFSANERTAFARGERIPCRPDSSVGDRDRDRDRLREDRSSPRLCGSTIGKNWRRSRYLIEIRKDRDLDLRSFPRRSNNAVVGCCVCKFRCYITEHCCTAVFIIGVCAINIVYNVVPCVVWSLGLQQGGLCCFLVAKLT